MALSNTLPCQNLVTERIFLYIDLDDLTYGSISALKFTQNVRQTPLSWIAPAGNGQVHALQYSKQHHSDQCDLQYTS